MREQSALGGFVTSSNSARSLLWDGVFLRSTSEELMEIFVFL